jgi:hypothetical protein
MIGVTKVGNKEFSKAISAKHLDVAIWIMTLCTVLDTVTSLWEKF